MRSVSEARAVRKMTGMCCQLGMRPDALADVEAVRVGEHDVEDDQIGALAAAQFDGVFAGLGADHRESFLFQVVLDQGVQIGVVFN